MRNRFDELRWIILGCLILPRYIRDGLESHDDFLNAGLDLFLLWLDLTRGYGACLKLISEILEPRTDLLRHVPFTCPFPRRPAPLRWELVSSQEHV